MYCLLTGITLVVISDFIASVAFDKFADPCAEYDICDQQPDFWYEAFSKILSVIKKVLILAGLIEPNLGSDEKPVLIATLMAIIFHIIALALLILVLIAESLCVRYPNTSLTKMLSTLIYELNLALSRPTRKGPMDNVFITAFREYQPVIMILSTNSVHVGYVAEIPSLTEKIEDSSLSFLRVYSGYICDRRRIEINTSKINEMEIIDLARGLRENQKLEIVKDGEEKGDEYTYKEIQQMTKSLTISIPYEAVMEVTILDEHHSLKFALEGTNE